MCSDGGIVLLHSHRAICCYAFGVTWLNSRGLGLLQSLMCYRTGMQFFVQFACQTLLLMSQPATELAVGADLVSLSKFVLDCPGRPVAMKNGLNWGNGFVIGDAMT